MPTILDGRGRPRTANPNEMYRLRAKGMDFAEIGRRHGIGASSAEFYCRTAALQTVRRAHPKWSEFEVQYECRRQLFPESLEGRQWAIFIARREKGLSWSTFASRFGVTPRQAELTCQAVARVVAASRSGPSAERAARKRLIRPLRLAWRNSSWWAAFDGRQDRELSYRDLAQESGLTVSGVRIACRKLAQLTVLTQGTPLNPTEVRAHAHELLGGGRMGGQVVGNLHANQIIRILRSHREKRLVEIGVILGQMAGVKPLSRQRVLQLCNELGVASHGRYFEAWRLDEAFPTRESFFAGLKKRDGKLANLYREFHVSEVTLRRWRKRRGYFVHSSQRPG